MSSTKNDKRPIKDPLFKIDPETGKMIPLPVKWPNFNSVNDRSEKKCKRIITIAPLVMTAADFEEPPIRSSKIRKVDNSVRKELFHLPPKRSQTSRIATNTRRTLSRRSLTSQKVQQKKFKPSELSPLLDMEEMEEELMKKKGFLQGYPFKTPSKPAIKFSTVPHVKNSPKNIPNIVITSESQLSNESEFLRLEKMCCTDPEKQDEYNKSPVSSVCNLLEGTVINSSRKEKNNVVDRVNTQQNLINDIENRLMEWHTAFNEYKASHTRRITEITETLEADRKHYENLVALQKNNTDVINNILKELKHASPGFVDPTEANKENSPIHNRRSIRLLNKSPLQAYNAKLVVSPALSKSKDLRKTTLTKNLVTKSQQYNIESPRIKKALDLYNSMRGDVSVLATPKFDRFYLNESPRSSNLSRNLSRRIQNQCLLLQDTPVHK